MADTSELGRKLIEYRAQHDLTQEELAKLLGYSRQSIANWETYRRHPKLSVVYDIEKKIDIQLDHELFLKDAAKKSKDFAKKLKEQTNLKNFLDSIGENYQFNKDVDLCLILKNYDKLKDQGIDFKFKDTELSKDDVTFLYNFIKTYFDNKNKD